MSGRVDSLSHSHDTRHHNTSHCCASTTIATYSLRHMFMQPGPTLILRLYTMCFYLCHWLLFGNLNTVRPPKKTLSRPFRHRFRCRFSSNIIPRRHRRKNMYTNMYTVCQKKPVAKRLFAGAKRLLRAPSSEAASSI